MLWTFYFTVYLILIQATNSDSSSKECCQYGGWVKTVIECSPSQVYNVKSQLCCQGNVRQKKTSRDECCGTEAFDPTGDAKCCDYFADNGFKYNVSAPPAGSDKDDVQCCGAVAMNRKRSKCCFVDQQYGVNDDPTDQLYMCCGLKLFDRKKQVCCVGLAGESPPKTYTLFPLVGNKTNCCATKISNQLYDLNTETCCGGKVISNKLGCCGEKSFDPQKEFCCYSTSSSSLSVWTKNTPNDACCGPDGRYNTKVDLCCAGQIVRNGLGGKIKCCSHVGLYDPETEICCVSREMKSPIIKSKNDTSNDINKICNRNLEYILNP